MKGADIHHATAFGLRWQSDIALAPFAPASHGPADVTISATDRLPHRVPLRTVNTGEVFADGIRLRWGDEAVFDMVDGNRITYLPGPAWTGAFPASLFGTVAALTLAWREALPLHACAVELDGEAFLIAGRSGSGKSTLTAGLVGLGARFIGDDLSVLHSAGPRLILNPGRTTMRLDAALAATIDATDAAAVPDDPRGKWQLRPRNRTLLPELPVAGMLLLGAAPGAIPPVARPAAFEAQLFRPRWLAALPQRVAHLKLIMAHAPHLPMSAFPAITGAAEARLEPRAMEAMAALRRMRGS